MLNQTDVAANDDNKRRKLDTGDAPVPYESVTTGCTEIVPAVGTDVRNWLHKIGLGQYADDLVAKGLDDLEFLQQRVDLKKLQERLKKDKTMLAFHLEKFICKLEECRAPIDKAGSSIASMTAMAPVTSSGSSALTTAPAFSTPSLVCKEVVPDYSQASHELLPLSACAPEEMVDMMVDLVVDLMVDLPCHVLRSTRPIF